MADAVIEGRGPEIIRLIAQIKREAGALAPSRSEGVPFPFRGIDGVVNHLVGKINEYGIVTAPRVLRATTTERAQGNRTVKTTDIEVEYTFYAPDGSFIQAVTNGLADDYADRSAAQAQSVAFRIALLQTFFLPTQSPEPEQTCQVVQDGATGQPAPTQAVARAAAGSATKPPTKAAEDIEALRAQLKAVAEEAASKIDGLKPDFYLALAKEKKLATGWPKRPGDLKALIKAVQNGEVPSE
jgi:hypothetical protein